MVFPMQIPTPAMAVSDFSFHRICRSLVSAFTDSS